MTQSHHFVLTRGIPGDFFGFSGTFYEEQSTLLVRSNFFVNLLVPALGPRAVILSPVGSSDPKLADP